MGGCSQISKTTSQLVDKVSSRKRPAPLKQLEPVKPTINSKIVWQMQTGSNMGEYSVHPFLDSTAVYVAGGRSAQALRKNDGKTLWKASLGEIISAGMNGSFLSKVNRSSTNQVFLGTISGNAIALDAKSGKIQWIERLSSEVQAVSESHENRVIFRTVDGKIHGLSSSTGELIWQRSQPAPALTQLGSSVPVVVPPLVIAGFDNGKVAAYNLNSGKDVWEVTLALPRGFTDLERRIDVDGKIKPLGNALFAASLNGSYTGINMESGNQAWSRAFSSPNGVNANPTGLYTVDEKGNVWKFEPQSGDPMWSMDDLQKRLPTVPAIVNDSLLVVGDRQGNLHWINATNGQFVNRHKGDPAGYSVEPEVSGNEVYAIGKSGLLTKLTLN